MKNPTKKTVSLVEYRIFSLPQMLCSNALSKWHEKGGDSVNSPGATAKASLTDLQGWWTSIGRNEVQASVTHEVFSRQTFENVSTVLYRAVGHPENTVTEPEGGELLEILPDDTAIKAIRALLGADASSPNGWLLDSVSAYVPAQSRFGIQIASFSPGDPGNLKPENLDHLSNRTAQRLDRLWPLVYSALRYAERGRSGAIEKSLQEAGIALWTNDKLLFGLPDKLRTQSELNPVEEYDFYNVLFMSGNSIWARSCEPFNNIKENDRTEGFEKYVIPANGKNGDEEIHLSRAMTLWQTRPMTEIKDVIDRVLRVSLASRLMKNLTYNYRLQASALRENYFGGKGLTSKDLRNIAFRYDIAHQALSERRQYLSKTEYDIVQLHLELSRFDEYVSNCSYLSERVLMAAESVDADKQRIFEITIQISAFLFAAIAMAAVFMDGYNFLSGAPDQIPGNTPARHDFILSVIMALSGVLILIALAYVSITKIMRWLRKS